MSRPSASGSANVHPHSDSIPPPTQGTTPSVSRIVTMASQMNIDDQKSATDDLVYSIDAQSTNFVGEGRQLIAGVGGAQTGGGHVARPEDIRRGNESILQRAEFDQLVARVDKLGL